MSASEWGRRAYDRHVRSFLVATPKRTFILYPALVVAFRVLRGIGIAPDRAWALPMLAWGYLQYRLCGDYRQRLHAGTRGIERPPDKLLQTGPYAYTRNPMYLGHLIFLLGLALAFPFRGAWLLWGVNAAWFHRRVLWDEDRLRAKFGAVYDGYCQRVRRWIPGLF